MSNIRWGIIGTGNIANAFATGLQSVDDADLVAIGSRSQESADAFADKYDAPKRHSSYEALATDPEVDAVYVSTPHSFHMDNAILCLENGKAALVEKPFAINAEQASKMIAVAQEKAVFLMEAMWTRFIPAMVKVREILAEGTIGDIRMVQADFGFRTRFNPEGRLFKPELGGGGLLDVGIYPISLASMVYGGAQPEAIASLAELGETGVDEQSGYVFRYAGGEMAMLWSAVRTASPQVASIIGTEGRIEIHNRWWIPKTLTLYRSGEESETIEVPFEGNGYNYEAIEVGNCLRADKTESETMPLAETQAIMETMDRIRAQWGLKYPME